MEPLKRRVGSPRMEPERRLKPRNGGGGSGRPYTLRTVKRRPLVILLMLPCLVLGGAHQWHWVKVNNNAMSGWDVATGNADVVIKGKQFTAALFWNGSDTDVQITLKGSIAADKLTVKETVQNSDFYSGST